MGIIPASQAKRKHNFELVIEIPAKRFKALNYPTPSSSVNNSVASSSRVTLDTPVAGVPKPAKHRKRPPLIRKIPSVAFKVNLDPKIRDIAVTRSFMGSYFGAHQRFQFSRLPVHQIIKHGYDHFVFIHGVRMGVKVALLAILD